VQSDFGVTDVSSAGTAVQVIDQTTRVVWIKFTAPTANSGLTYVGLSDVSATNGYPLGASGGVDATLELDFRPDGSIALSAFYVDAATNGDDVAWAYIAQ
jgi:hypothetical protein